MSNSGFSRNSARKKTTAAPIQSTEQRGGQEKYGRRLLICDPTCVLPYGHTVPALNIFRNQLSKYFDETQCIASLGLPEKIAAENKFERRFTFLYNRYIPIMPSWEADGALTAHAAYNSAYADPYERIATRDAEEMLREYGMTGDDVIYFPGADFYGVIGHINAYAKLPSSRRPALFVRLIGVLENASPFYDDPLSVFCERIKDAVALGIKVHLSAETPAYADEIAVRTGVVTLATPYPDVSPLLPLPDHDTFNVLCAGSARTDKGFLELFDIAHALLSKPTLRPVTIISQTMPVRGSEQYDGYTSKLYALRNVELLEPTITTEKMHRLYADCDIVLLPYAEDVYRLRGSAVMMEAASVGRPCVTLRKTAFARQVEYYGLGEIVDTVKEIPSVIQRMAAADRSESAARIRQARMRFYLDVRSSYDSWFRAGRA